MSAKHSQGHLQFGQAGNRQSGLEQYFHPAVAAWFEACFEGATEVQRQAWSVTTRRQSALIAAPTGSGKTLAAFMGAINDLVAEGLSEGLANEVHVLYVSPLKALSNDIQKNLQEPLNGIRHQLMERGYGDVPIRDAVRTGDTTPFERQRMRREPPHILVTTPESLFILLTSASGRDMLKSVRSVIVDELHVVAGSKRGAHLMLSLERLEALCAEAGRPSPVRIGLSATQKPIEDMAQFLVGAHAQLPQPPSVKGKSQPSAGEGVVEIIDTGHSRERDIAIEVPPSPLEAVMANEVWAEIYERLAELSQEHHSILVFVNQRRLAERAARHLAERIGEENVTAHHGSLAKEHRLDAEQRLKAGKLKVLVATASLELGIDIGDIDLVCQLGSPRSIAAFLQRVGRAGHAVKAIPKGRLFPLSLDDLVECSALLDSVRRGELDRIHTPAMPRDVLAQQIIAEVACREWGVDELYAVLCRAAPYRDMDKAGYLDIVKILADGFTTRRGRRGAYLHFDQVNGRLRGRRGASLAAVTNAGTIPDQFDYDVVLMPDGMPIGSLNEDFAFESLPGDIFQLGNASYRILKLEAGKVLVEDARGMPPNIPFWFGEAPGRTDELSQSVSRLRGLAEQQLTSGVEACCRWLTTELGLPEAAAMQLAQYLGAANAALGCLPTQQRIVFERFFDETGDTHFVVHAPFGSRINRAWGLALRKKFCRQFNFELQASALEDSLILSLGPTHSFPLEEPASYVKSASARHTLEQAILQAPMFPTRWRWVASVALAVKRNVGGKRVIPQFQRTDAEDLLTVVFPDAVACQDNLPGEREVPDHPLIRQTLEDCLHEVMDYDGFEAVLKRIEAGEIEIVCCDLTAPSPLSEAILNARPYAFLDDGAAEERRTLAVRSQGLGNIVEAADLGKLDVDAIDRVRQEVQPAPVDADELHDALVVHGFLTEAEGAAWNDLFDQLYKQRRAALVNPSAGESLWVAAERLAEFRAVLPQAEVIGDAPVLGQAEDELSALREVLRGRLDLLAVTTEQALAAPLGLSLSSVQQALLALQTEGYVMRGSFDPRVEDVAQCCERRLLARIHRYTRERKRAEIEPVAPAAFMRYLFAWQGLQIQSESEGSEDLRREGEAGMQAALLQLEGYPVAAGAWETDILPVRIKRYLPNMLDSLCAAGHVVWQRAQQKQADSKSRSGPIKSTPIQLFPREHAAAWRPQADDEAPPLSSRGERVLAVLKQQGASFFVDLVQDCSMLRTEVEQALAELVSQGLVSSDSFTGLRALLAPSRKRPGYGRQQRRRRPVAGSLNDIDAAGRWSLVRHRPLEAAEGGLAAPEVEHIARVLLQRYGVVFRRLLARESGLPPWRELFYVYRRMEARGEIRGGRFVTGFAGEQFVLPEAMALLKRHRESGEASLVTISAADPLNLVGILLPGNRVPAVPGNRILFRDGQPVALQLGDEVRFMDKVEAADEWLLRNRLLRQARPAGYLQRPALPH